MHTLLKLFRFIIITAIWMVMYANFAAFVFAQIWNFPLFNPNAWDMIPSEWQNGWIIDTPSEFFFFFTIFLLIPLFFVGLVIVLKTHWSKVFKDIQASMLAKQRASHRQSMDKFPEPTELAKMLLDKANNKGKQISTDKRPPKIDGVTPLARSETTVSQTKIKQDAIPEKDVPTLADISKENSDNIAAAQTLKEPKLTSRLEVKYKVICMAEEAGIKLVQDLKIGKDVIDFAFIVKGEVYLANLEPIGAEWVVDEIGNNDDEPLWFSETKYAVSPVFQLSRATDLFSEALQKLLDQEQKDSITVHKLLLLGSGSILNYDDICNIWQDDDVAVYRLTGTKPDSLPLLDEFLNKIKDKGTNAEDILEKIYTAFVAVEP